jgi:small subunit ribosomal protein S17
MKIFTGKVISTKMAKTAKVAVTRLVEHPVYKKRVKIVKNFLVHDEQGVRVGDTVKFVPTKPYSKMKRWAIIEEKKTKETKKKLEAKPRLEVRSPQVAKVKRGDKIRSNSLRTLSKEKTKTRRKK